MRRWHSLFFTAWVGVATQKVRSSLTILGIVIGIAAVISLMSIGKGAEAEIMSRIQNLGSNLITVRSGAVTVGGVRGASGSSTRLTVEDSEAIIRQVPLLDAVAPIYTSNIQLIVGKNNTNTQVTGTTPDYMKAYNLSNSAGSFFSDYEYQQGDMVVVLGSNIAQTLFPGVDAVGHDVRMGTAIATVKGILESKGSGVGSPDNGVFIPLTAMQKAISQPRTPQGDRVISSISLTVIDDKQTDYVMGEITSLLRHRHNIASGADNDFTVSSMLDLVETISETTRTMTIFLAAIAAISLLVGGIGVMNVMLVSVLERTSEIGVRKAMGAMEHEIWIQFLIEAILLTIVGGVIGIFVGWLVAYIVSKLGLISTLVSVDIIILAVCVSAGIGISFGFYPAWRASRLNPIDALRHE